MSGVRRSGPISLHSTRSIMESSDSENDEVQNRAVEEGAIGNVGVNEEDEQMAESEGNANEGNVNVQHEQSAAGSVMSRRPNLVERVVPDDECLRIMENNCVLLFEETRFKPEHRIIMELFKYHPYRKWFTRNKSVPVQYIQQWWKHLRLVGNRFISEIGGVTITLTISALREMINLPEKDDLQTRTDFEDAPLTEEIIAEVVKLGYNDGLRNLSTFMQVGIKLDISADLQSLFTWNTKQVL